MYVRTCIYKYINSIINTYVHSLTELQASSNMNVNVHTVHTVHTYIHTYIHTYMENPAYSTNLICSFVGDISESVALAARRPTPRQRSGHRAVRPLHR